MTSGTGAWANVDDARDALHVGRHPSGNFLRHAHEPTGCDLIVCWEHNWPESPLEVVELKGAVMREIGGSPTSRDIGKPIFTTEARRRGENLSKNKI